MDQSSCPSKSPLQFPNPNSLSEVYLIDERIESQRSLTFLDECFQLRLHMETDVVCSCDQNVFQCTKKLFDLMDFISALHHK